MCRMYPNTVVEELIGVVEDEATTDITEVIREEVERPVSKLKNGQALGSNDIAAEFVKNGGQRMMDWLWELLREVWRTKQVNQEWKNASYANVHQEKERHAPSSLYMEGATTCYGISYSWTLDSHRLS